ncbi:MAG TPA: LysR substrate-binding domain-containing protein [Stellaceae bacterium]|nr:LysR substrate-binding domain-containing protein [Stellaceae bacterium]
MATLNLDIDVLRTLVAAQQLGAFNRAAKQVGRSQSAISQQIRKLEDRVGQPLFRKQGRGLVLTEAGEILLAYARRILDLNDEGVAALRGVTINGVVRFGLPGDFAETWLPAALGRFKRAHPSVRVEATVDRNTSLVDRLEKGQLDLAVLVSGEPHRDGEVLATLPMVWIGAVGDSGGNNGEPLPLAVFEPPCLFRAAAIAALDKAGIPWRIAFTSPSLSGLWAAIDAGLGITVRTAAGLPSHLATLDQRAGLPPLPSVHLLLGTAGRMVTPAAARLRDILRETMPANLALPGGTIPSKAALG